MSPTVHYPNDVQAAIRTRRSFSLKELSPEPINLELIAAVLEAANWAPSHGKTEPWRFVVYRGDARQLVSQAQLDRRAGRMQRHRAGLLRWRQRGQQAVVHVLDGVKHGDLGQALAAEG